MNFEIPPRYELKYLINEEKSEAVRSALLPFCELDSHSAHSPRNQYLIQSLYLDTPRHDLYWASRLENPRRYKARVRCYGPEGPVFFELKRKAGSSVIRKSRARIPREHWQRRLSGPFPEDASPMELDFRSQVDRHLLEPTTLVRYHREAWVGLFEDYSRVTFDRAVLFQPHDRISLDADETAWQSLDDAYSTQGVRGGVILELKATFDVPRWMVALVERFDLFRRSFSKYCLGIERGYGARSFTHLASRRSRPDGGFE
jgi:hypothetical protein